MTDEPLNAYDRIERLEMAKAASLTMPRQPYADHKYAATDTAGRTVAVDLSTGRFQYLPTKNRPAEFTPGKWYPLRLLVPGATLGTEPPKAPAPPAKVDRPTPKAPARPAGERQTTLF